MRARGTVRTAVLWIAAAGLGGAALPAQEPQKVQGEAILQHPIGKLAIRSAELLHAGKINEAVALGTKADQAEWKAASASEREFMGARKKERAPSPADLREAIRKSGELTINPANAALQAKMGADGIMAFYELEGGQWRASTGPMIVRGVAEPAKRERIQGAAILEHPIGKLALQYLDLVHAGKMEEAMKLTLPAAQARWKSWPASERAASAAYNKKNLPTRAALTKELKAGGGELVIEDDVRAGLNLIRIEQKSTEPGVVESTSTTTSIGFTLDGGTWKLTQ